MTPKNIALFRNPLHMADYSTMQSTADGNEDYDNVMIIYRSLFEIPCPVKLVKLKRKTLNENRGLLRAY